ncbi:MAG: hypothetical protein SFW66_08935 [Gammaproteobacteria bacterium]|nr:hypothetical protein [Gammaproteobacteria bacterium]
MEDGRLESLKDDTFERLKKQFAEDEKFRKKLEIALAALNDIAVWSDGETVGPHFDEPGSARIARKAIVEINEL